MTQTYNTLLYKVDDDGIATLTINRPDKLNALNGEVLNELSEVTEVIKSDDNAKGVIITGAGEKAFVAGADIKEINSLDKSSGEEFSQKGQQVFQAIEDLKKPVIAAVNGYALGGGCELALACHIRIAGDEAQFGLPETSLGLIPGYGGTQRLSRLAGKAKALEMILTAQPVKADAAKRIGLANRVDPNPVLEAENMLKKIFKNGPLAVESAIKAVRSAGDEDGFETEAHIFGQLCSTEDADEGTSAFLEKRKPEFNGS